MSTGILPSVLSMKYRNVYLESFGYTLPEEVITTDELEHRLAPVYERLRLPHGRLELMTGIQVRRFFPPGTTPSSQSILSGEKALRASGIDRRHVGALVHGSVCRDFLEPATACGVHHGLNLPSDCLVYDVSNACLGLLSGLIQVANMIELGQIRAGLVVGTECGRQLVENTVHRLNTDPNLTRQDIKHLIASLTIGSGSVAMLVCDKELTQTGNQIMAASFLARTDQHQLCQSEGLQPFMHTDSERLMHEGVATGAETFTKFLAETGWQRNDIDKTVCHQVGTAQRKMLFETLELDSKIDYTSLETLGNTGAAALPLTMALALEHGHILTRNRVAMMGIGSGINCLMIGAHWQTSRVLGNFESAEAVRSR